MFVVKMTTWGYRNMLNFRVGKYIIAVIYINITCCEVKRVSPIELNTFYFIPFLIYKNLTGHLYPPTVGVITGSLISTSSYPISYTFETAHSFSSVPVAVIVPFAK